MSHSYEDQGTGFDPGAAGHERQGRATTGAKAVAAPVVVWVRGELVGRHVDGQPLVRFPGENGQGPTTVWVDRAAVFAEPRAG